MFALLAQAALAGREGPYCQAPRAHAPPVPNKTLAYAQVVFRHGHRTPLNAFLDRSARGSWSCNSPDLPGARTTSAPSRRYRFYHRVLDQRYVDFPPSCRMGDLTSIGMDQHVQLGAMYRHYLVDELGFLPEKLDPSFLTIVSSPVDRCLRSCESWLAGLYPPENPNEVLSIETGSQDVSDVVVRGSFCKEVEEALANWSKSETTTKFVNDNYEKLKPALEQVGLTEKTFTAVTTLCGWAIAHNCSDAVNPDWLTPEVVDICRQTEALDQFNKYVDGNVSRGLFGSYSMRKMMRVADEQLGNAGSKKLAIFSTHDTTVAAVLVALGILDTEMPPYASHILAEYWKDAENVLWIRWVYNGVPVKLDLFNNETLVRFDEFRRAIDPIIDHCTEHEE